DGKLVTSSSSVLYKTVSLREQRKRSWPFAANFSAKDLPIPLEAPVMTTFIVSLISSFFANLQSPMKYRHLFFDLDHTLWDFEANSRQTLEVLYSNLQLDDRGINDVEVFYRNYLAHNEELWERYGKGYIKQD